MRSFFQFAFRRSDGSTKFVVVEAATEEQCECVKEAVAAGLDERCVLLAEFANAFAVRLYNDAFQVVEFAEFMADLAGFDGLPTALQERITAACEVEEAAPVRAEAKSQPEAVPGQSERLVAALVGMGFRKGSVSKWVQTLGPRAESAPLPALVKDGVRALVSAPAN